jgi:hypothetical protein
MPPEKTVSWIGGWKEQRTELNRTHECKGGLDACGYAYDSRHICCIRNCTNKNLVRNSQEV